MADLMDLLRQQVLAVGRTANNVKNKLYPQTAPTEDIGELASRVESMTRATQPLRDSAARTEGMWNWLLPKIRAAETTGNRAVDTLMGLTPMTDEAWKELKRRVNNL
jgi:hypothetical protein